MQAVLLADNPLGPWKMQEKPVVINYNSEDPEVWYDAEREHYIIYTMPSAIWA